MSFGAKSKITLEKRATDARTQPTKKQRRMGDDDDDREEESTIEIVTGFEDNVIQRYAVLYSI